MLYYLPLHKSPASDEFVVYDTETTGVSNEFDELLEIGALLVKNGKVKQEFHRYIKPVKPISQEITEINGITNEMVEKAPSAYEAIQDFLLFAGNKVVVTYNGDAFDNKFIKNASQFYFGKSFWNRSIDVMTLAKKILKKPTDVKDYKLGTCVDFFKVKFDNRHTANSDCLATFKLYIELQCKQFPDLEKEIRDYYAEEVKEEREWIF
jgi:DNA polymerase-3 subunit alpha (Gram-positive type)